MLNIAQKVQVSDTTKFNNSNTADQTIIELPLKIINEQKRKFDLSSPLGIWGLTFYCSSVLLSLFRHHVRGFLSYLHW